LIQKHKITRDAFNKTKFVTEKWVNESILRGKISDIEDFDVGAVFLAGS